MPRRPKRTYRRTAPEHWTDITHVQGHLPNPWLASPHLAQFDAEARAPPSRAAMTRGRELGLPAATPHPRYGMRPYGRATARSFRRPRAPSAEELEAAQALAQMADTWERARTEGLWPARTAGRGSLESWAGPPTLPGATAAAMYGYATSHSVPETSGPRALPQSTPAPTLNLARRIYLHKKQWREHGRCGWCGGQLSAYNRERKQIQCIACYKDPRHRWTEQQFKDFFDFFDNPPEVEVP